MANADPPLGRATIATSATHGLWVGGIPGTDTNIASVYLTNVSEAAFGTVGSVPPVGPLDPGPGPGWLGVQDGYLLGDPDGAGLFRGTTAMLTNRRLRAGRRRLGDQFHDTTTATTITSDTVNGGGNCYRGVSWSAFLGYGVSVGDPLLGFPAVVCETDRERTVAGRGP